MPCSLSIKLQRLLLINLDLSLIDLSGVTKEHFSLKNPTYVSLFSISDDGYVYGTIGLELMPNGNVTAFLGYDTYDFDMKPLSLTKEGTARNANTLMGLIVHGKGQAFNIIFYGEGKIGK